MKKKLLKKIVSIISLLIISFSGIVQASTIETGYGWNKKIGWVDFSNVEYNSVNHKFSGIAKYDDGNFEDENGLSKGEIDCTEQDDTQLSLSLSTTADANGNYPITGQCFSNQIGWVMANVDNNIDNYAALKPNGELTGNFWSDSIGWINVSSNDINIQNVQIWSLDNPEDTENSSINSSGHSRLKKSKTSHVKIEKKDDKTEEQKEKEEQKNNKTEEQKEKEDILKNSKCPYFTKYYRMGDTGIEVIKIQAFLKEQGYYNDTLSSYYGTTTDRAVRTFQAAYPEEILTPWYLTTPTGYWYKTTRAKANEIAGCKEEINDLKTNEWNKKEDLELDNKTDEEKIAVLKEMIKLLSERIKILLAKQ